MNQVLKVLKTAGNIAKKANKALQLMCKSHGYQITGVQLQKVQIGYL